MALSIIHVFRAPIGGLFRHVTDLARGQIKRGHKVGIIADSTTGNDRSEEIFADLTPSLALGLTRIPMQRALSPLDAAATFHVARRIRESGADVIHGHGAKGGAFARLAKASRNVVRAYTPHGGSLLLRHDNLSGQMYLFLERMLLKRRTLYLYESAYSDQVFRAKIGEPRGLARIVHNGVARSEFESIIPAHDQTDLVFVGEFRPVKGIDVLIKAIAMLYRQGQPVTATLVGGGPDEPLLRQEAERLVLSHAVRFVAPMPAREAFALGKIIVIPSFAESLPYVILESAAAGMPLITTKVGGIPEIYGSLGNTLIEPGNVAALANAIANKLDYPVEAQLLAQQLRDRVWHGFRVELMVDAVIASYEDALP